MPLNIFASIEGMQAQTARAQSFTFGGSGGIYSQQVLGCDPRSI